MMLKVLKMVKIMLKMMKMIKMVVISDVLELQTAFPGRLWFSSTGLQAIKAKYGQIFTSYYFIFFLFNILKDFKHSLVVFHNRIAGNILSNLLFFTIFFSFSRIFSTVCFQMFLQSARISGCIFTLIAFV